jgi:hypothetical protein
VWIDTDDYSGRVLLSANGKGFKSRHADFPERTNPGQASVESGSGRTPIR